MNIFGSTYEEVGNLSANLVLQTAGKIKIRFGKKFIDLLDEKGNINVKIPKILNEVKSKDEMKSDGLYILDGDLYIYYKGNIIQATGIEGHFIDYENNQKLSQEQINRAQNNIGLTFDSTKDALKTISEGIIFIQDKIFYVNSENIKELTLKGVLKGIDSSDLEEFPKTENVGIIWNNGKWNYVNVVTENDFEEYKKEIEEIIDQEGQESPTKDEILSVFDPIQYSKAYTIKSFSFLNSYASFECFQNIDLNDSDLCILSVEGYYGNIVENEFVPNLTNVYKTYVVSLSKFPDESYIEKYAKGIGKDEQPMYPDAVWSIDTEKEEVTISRTEKEYLKSIRTLNFKYKNNYLYYLNSNNEEIVYTINNLKSYIVITYNNTNFGFKYSENLFQGNHLYVKAEQSNPKKFRIDYNNAEIALEENYPFDPETNGPKIIPHTVFGDMEDSKSYYNDPPISFRTIHDRDNSQGLYSDQAVFTGVEFRGKWPDEEAELEVKDYPRYSAILNNLLCSLEEVPEEYNQVIPSVQFIKNQLGKDYVIGAEYVSEDKKIYLYKSGQKIASEIDATDFIKDGMVSKVEVDSKIIEGEETECLIITFNEDSGQEEIDIPLSKIFDSKLYYTKEEINDKLKDSMPLGSIIMWAYNTIPDGWHICDGTVLSGNDYKDFIDTLGSTLPDLRNKFIVGAGDEYNLGNTGGEKQHTLTTDELPSHSHAFKDYYYVENENALTERNITNYDKITTNNGGGSNSTDDDNDSLMFYSHDTLNAGEGLSHENRPPYYALFYIIKVKNN